SKKELSEIFFPFGRSRSETINLLILGTLKRFFQCIISGSNGIHRYRKKPSQIEILPFDQLCIRNTIYKEHYYK
ncbi:hypothetical protein LINPERPRIM_LOCUS43739, partial [Linum perenne]